MNIVVIGAGPGGAYAAFLLQKLRPEWEVTVYERSPPAVTYGWGVVLPEKIYEKLRTVDRPTCERIEERNTQWDPIDTIHRGEHVRCGGFPYTSILRTDLLEILQERCETLDVALRFESEVEDVDAVASEADLVIGADGIHSRTRDRYSDQFGTTLSDGENLFSWFGTEQEFEALTHVYSETDDGLWHAGAYPGRTSTFVVTCDPETWRSAGVDEMSESTYVTYLEDVFADSLDGHSLLSRNDSWRPFTTVSNETWYYDDVVLLGDAAHTAHFTIGSGTRMAIEDAIELARALDERGTDLEAALEEYEAERKPHVDGLQRAAERSRRHFETIEHYANLDPLPFAALYLTRTGHTTYESLRERDQSFVDELDRWFAAQATGRIAGNEPGPPLEQPLSLGDRTVPNRLASMPDLEISVSERVDESQQDRLLEAGERAGLVVLSLTVTDAQDAPTGTAIVDGDRLNQWEDVVAQFERRNNGLIGARLAFDPADTDSQSNAATDRLQTSVASAAKLLGNAGFGVLEVDIRGFRGSDPSRLSVSGNRTALSPSILGTVRTVWPAERPLGATIPVSASDDDELEAVLSIARELVGSGCDFLTLTRGQETEAESRSLGEYGKSVRNHLDAPVLLEGKYSSPDPINTALATGRADLCEIALDSFNGSDS